MANLTYRQATQVAPSSTTTKNAPLTSAEIDGNLKSLNDELTLKAPLASPALTGTPTAPTATAGTNTTQIATTAFVIGERSNAATLTNKTITLGDNTVSGTKAEFDAALSDDNFAYTGGALDQFASTTSAQLAGVISDETGTGSLVFANSPVLSGVPTAPTAATGTNTTQIATTAFVQSAVPVLSVAGKTGTVLLTKADVGLANVENTSDADKPVSTAVQAMFNALPTFASAAENAAGSIEGKMVDPLGIREAFNATGSAPVYACRAWVNFNGTGTVAIRASGNVSSITDNGVGDYTVNFATAMPDANYAVAPTSNGTSTGLSATAQTASATRILTWNSSAALFDRDYVSCSIFR